MDRKNILMFALGVTIGAVVTALYLNEKHQRFLENESDWCEKTAREIKESVEVGEEQETKVLVMNKDRYKKIVTNYSNAEEIPVKRQKEISEVPYIITFEQFCEDFDHHDKCTITYYQGDETLVDEEEEIIADARGLIGEETLERFGHGSDDPDVVYVRNEKMAIDYEVVRQENNYKDLVYGENKET